MRTAQVRFCESRRGRPLRLLYACLNSFGRPSVGNVSCDPRGIRSEGAHGRLFGADPEQDPAALRTGRPPLAELGAGEVPKRASAAAPRQSWELMGPWSPLTCW